MVLAWLLAGCGDLGVADPKQMLEPRQTWDRYHIDYEGIGVELRVPPGGELPAFKLSSPTALMSPYLLSLRYGLTRDYLPKLWVVAYFLKRVYWQGSDLTLEQFREESVEFDRQNAAAMNLQSYHSATPLAAWQEVQIGSRTWFTETADAGVFPYLTVASPTLLLEVRGTTDEKDPRILDGYRRVVERIASQITVVQ